MIILFAYGHNSSNSCLCVAMDIPGKDEMRVSGAAHFSKASGPQSSPLSPAIAKNRVVVNWLLTKKKQRMGSH